MKQNIRFLIISIGVILVWRGVWMLADAYLLPNSPIASAIISAVAGIIIILASGDKLNDIF